VLSPLSLAERALGIAAGLASSGLRAAEQAVTVARGRARGGGPPKSQLTDAALARKVESELFRDARVPKGRIDVNAVGRVVYLRGEAPTATMVADLTRRAQEVAEVERVENLVTLPKAPPPKRSRRTAAKPAQTSSSTAKKARRPVTRRVNAEAQSSKGGPSPKEMAAKRAGRKPAPMGSEDRGRPAPVNADRSSSSKAEPAPKDLAAKREGRKPAPMGSSDVKGNGQPDPAGAAPKPGEDVGS